MSKKYILANEQEMVDNRFIYNNNSFFRRIVYDDHFKYFYTNEQ